MAAALLLANVQPGWAATMADVNNEKGHAFLVSYGGNCYAVLPDHVATSDRISLVSPLPQTAGVGSVFWRSAEDDLALAYVEGELADHCEQKWDPLNRKVGPLLQEQGAGSLARINWGGDMIDRAEGVVIDADETQFVVNTTESWAEGEVEGGVSGALYYRGRVPVGMALSAINNRRARFLRMDRIYALLDPVLNGKSAAHPAVADIATSTNGVGFRVTGQAVDMGGTLRGLAGTMQWPWTGAPIEIELTLSNEAPLPINVIRLKSRSSAEAGFAAPQRIKMELDGGMPGSPFWRILGVNDMPPNGVLDIPTGGSRARRIKLRIETVWGQAERVGLESIALE